MATTHFRTCPLCEATCGLAIDLEGDQVRKVRGDELDVASHGYTCPKGLAIGELHHDPDRVTTPLVRRARGSKGASPWGDSRLVPASWDEAWAAIAEGLGRVRAAGGNNALALYLGNPNVHTLAGQLYLPALAKALGTRNIFTASTADQMPKHVSSVLLYGDKLTVPIPDIERTDLLVILGADPMASNGSLWTAPDLPGKLRSLKRRGGRLVVVDPRRSRTAKLADVHLAIRPGTDALLLAAVAQVLSAEDLIDLGEHLAPHVDGVDAVRAAVAAFTPERVAPACGIAPDAIRALARELAAAPAAAVYGRIGTCTQRFGTLASWLVDVVDIFTGNLDRPGGVLFPLAPAGQRNSGPDGPRAPRFGRFVSRVRGIPEVLGELPVAVLAEEIDTPGDGRIRGLVTVAGNPALSAPDASRLDRALDELDFMVSVDLYVNETTRHADVLLPGCSPLEKGHWDLAFAQLAAHNVARWSPPIMERPADKPDEWEVIAAFAGVAGGAGPDANGVDELIFAALGARQQASPEIIDAVRATGRRGPERLLDLLLRTGPYKLSFDEVAAHPHGLDLGPLQPRLPEVLRTPSGKVELAPELILADLNRLAAFGDQLAADGDGLVLVGRRHLRSNNSWMHNTPSLVGGTNRCTLQIHPDDALRAGLVDGGRATVTSTAGAITVDIEITDAIRQGVVSLPHGWGHGVAGTQMDVAAAHAGANTNVLTVPEVEPLSGNAILNGIAVEVAAAP